MVDDNEDALLHPLGGPLAPEIVQNQELRVLDGVHPLVEVATRLVVSLAQVIQKLRHGHEQRRYPLFAHQLVHNRDREVGLPGPNPAAEVESSARLPVLIPALEVSIHLYAGPSRSVADSGSEV